MRFTRPSKKCHFIPRQIFVCRKFKHAIGRGAQLGCAACPCDKGDKGGQDYRCYKQSLGCFIFEFHRDESVVRQDQRSEIIKSKRNGNAKTVGFDRDFESACFYVLFDFNAYRLPYLFLSWGFSTSVSD